MAETQMSIRTSTSSEELAYMLLDHMRLAHVHVMSAREALDGMFVLQA